MELGIDSDDVDDDDDVFTAVEPRDRDPRDREPRDREPRDREPRERDPRDGSTSTMDSQYASMPMVTSESDELTEH